MGIDIFSVTRSLQIMTNPFLVYFTPDHDPVMGSHDCQNGGFQMLHVCMNLMLNILDLYTSENKF